MYLTRNIKNKKWHQIFRKKHVEETWTWFLQKLQNLAFFV